MNINPYWTFKKGTPEEEQIFEPDEAIALLLVEGVLFTNSYWFKKDWPEDAQRKTGIFVNCNDLFAWASADSTEIDWEEIQDLYDHYLKDPFWGPSVWCCKKEKLMPQKPVADKIREAGIWDLDSMGLKPNP